MDQPRKPRVMRGPDDGNSLWKLYSELGVSRRQEFKTALAEAGFDYWQFHQDSKAGRKLAQLPYARVIVYVDFFGPDFAQEIQHGPAAPLPATGGRRAPTTATQQYHENEGL